MRNIKQIIFTDDEFYNEIRKRLLISKKNKKHF